MLNKERSDRPAWEDIARLLGSPFRDDRTFEIAKELGKGELKHIVVQAIDEGGSDYANRGNRTECS